MNASGVRRNDHRPLASYRWIAATLAIPLLLGCSEAPTATRPPPNAVLSTADASPPNAGAYTGEYSWLQGQGATFLGSAAARICYLTSVAGNLDGYNEWVGLVVSMGNWYLTGASHTTGVSAKARCLHTSVYGAEITLSSAGGLKARSLSGQACGLTRVGGRFDSLVDHVTISEAIGGKRTLLVQTTSPGYVVGGVRCVITFSSPTHVTTPMPWHSPAAPRRFWFTVPAFCFLTAMGGAFEGSADWVWVIKTTSAWYLMGNRNNPDLYASASCTW